MSEFVTQTLCLVQLGCGCLCLMSNLNLGFASVRAGCACVRALCVRAFARDIACAVSAHACVRPRACAVHALRWGLGCDRGLGVSINYKLTIK